MIGNKVLLFFAADCYYCSLELSQTIQSEKQQQKSEYNRCNRNVSLNATDCGPEIPARNLKKTGRDEAPLPADGAIQLSVKG